MDLFVYSDESGVFDYIHNKYFVFAGLLLLGKNQKDEACRKYLNAEKALNSFGKYEKGYELKATHISNKEKGKLYRSLNSYYKFAVVINQSKVNKHIFDFKKSKQRYLDYTYKIGLKRLLEYLFENKVISPNDIENIHIFADEHTTATDGRYELQEALLQEFKIGTFNMEWNHRYPPIIPNLSSLHLKFCNSAKTALVRAADIIANKIYFLALNNRLNEISSNNIVITTQP